MIFLVCFFAGLLNAMTHSQTGICPACGSPQKKLGGIHRCDHCLAYGEVVKGEYPLVGITGFVELIALTWWGVELWRTMNLAHKHRSDVLGALRIRSDNLVRIGQQ